MFDDLEYLMDKAMSIAPPGTIDPNKLEDELKRSRASNQANPHLVQLAQSNLPLESFVRLAAQQPKVEEPRTIFKGGYDHKSAEEFESSTGMSLYDPNSQHWASRVFMGPNNGLILKEEAHKTFGRTVRGEKKAGTTLFRRRDPEGNKSQYNGRLYSFLPNESYDPSVYSPIPEEELNKWLYRSYDIGAIAESILPFEVAESNPESWGYDPDSQTFFPYDDSRGNLTAGIGSKIDGDRESAVRAQLAIVAPEIDYDDFKAGKVGLTRPQVDQMFMMNIREHIKTAEGLKVKLDDGIVVYPFENLHEFPKYIQEAIVNGVFWSMLTPAKSPKTMELIANGDWEGASKEVLIGKWQTKLKESGGSTWDRFLLLSDSMDRYGKELKGSKDSAYIVKEGDTLWGVSQDLGMTVEELQGLNPGINPKNIPVGYRLNVTRTFELEADTKESYTRPSSEVISTEELSKRGTGVLIDSEGNVISTEDTTFGLEAGEGYLIPKEEESVSAAEEYIRTSYESQKDLASEVVNAFSDVPFEDFLEKGLGMALPTVGAMQAAINSVEEAVELSTEEELVDREEKNEGFWQGISAVTLGASLYFGDKLYQRHLANKPPAAPAKGSYKAWELSLQTQSQSKLQKELYHIVKTTESRIRMSKSPWSMNRIKYIASENAWVKQQQLVELLQSKFNVSPKELDLKLLPKPQSMVNRDKFFKWQSDMLRKHGVENWKKLELHPTNKAIAKNIIETGVEPFKITGYKLPPEKVQVVVRTAVKSALGPAFVTETLAQGAKDFVSPTRNIESVKNLRQSVNTKTGKAGGVVFFLYSIIGLLRSMEEGDVNLSGGNWKTAVTEGWQGPWLREWGKGILTMLAGGEESIENMTIDNLMYYITANFDPRERARILAEIPESLHDVFVEPLIWAVENLPSSESVSDTLKFGDAAGRMGW